MTKHKSKIIYFLIITIILALGYIISLNTFTPPENFVPQRENFNFFDIFIRNFTSNIILLGLALSGPLSFITCSYIIFSIGFGVYKVQALYSTTLLKSFIGIFAHGMGEIFTISLIMWISIKVTHGWIKYLFTNDSQAIRKVYKYYFNETIIKTITLIFVILILSSIIEVYWSMPFFQALYNYKLGGKL